MKKSKAPDKVFNPAEILERISDAFVALDKNWCYTYMNKKAGEIFQRDPQQMIGKHIWTEFPEGVGQPFHKAYYEAMAEQKYIYLEEHYAPYDLWFENHIYPSPEGLSIYFRDISEKKRAEENIRMSHQRLTHHLNNNPLAIIEWDKNMIIHKWSAQAETIFGWTEAEVMNKHFNELNLVFEEDAGAVGIVAQELMTGAVDRNSTINRNNTKSGKVIYCQWFNSVLKDEHGNITSILSLIKDITERKKAEKIIQISETRLLKAQQIGKLGYWHQDLNSNTIWASKEAMRIYGFPTEEGELPTGKIAACIIDLDKVKQAAIDLVEYNKEYNIEIRINPADGSAMKYISALAELERNEKGEPVRIVGTLQCITERKKAEEKLQKSEELFSSAFHASPAGIIITQLSDSKIINANESFLAIFEFSREEAVGKTAAELNILSHEERAKLAQHQIATGGLKNFELLSQTKSGKPIILLFSSKLLELDGEACLITTLIDITERKKAEQEIQKLATIVQRSPEFIGIAGLDAKAIYLNDGGKQLVGLVSDITTTTMFDFFAPQDLEQFQTKVIPAIQKDGRWIGDIYLKHFQTGELIPVLMDIFYVYHPETKEPIAFATVTTDITERKESEDEILRVGTALRNLSNHLQVVREQERSHIAREIHDELGQYLTAIKMDASWLRNKFDGTDESMHQKLVGMISLIDETVGTVRRISGELRPAMLEDLGLIAALEWQCHEFEKRNSIPNAFTSSVEDLEIEKNNAIGIYRIIQEAFNNIIKHAQATAVETELTKTDTVLRIKIKDNGIGFDETQQKNKNSFGLLGMRERAMMMGGTLTIESEKDKGTTLSIELPLKNKK